MLVSRPEPLLNNLLEKISFIHYILEFYKRGNVILEKKDFFSNSVKPKEWAKGPTAASGDNYYTMHFRTKIALDYTNNIIRFEDFVFIVAR